VAEDRDAEELERRVREKLDFSTPDEDAMLEARLKELHDKIEATKKDDTWSRTYIEQPKPPLKSASEFRKSHERVGPDTAVAYMVLYSLVGYTASAWVIGKLIDMGVGGFLWEAVCTLVGASLGVTVIVVRLARRQGR